MKCYIEYTSAKGKRVRYQKSNQTVEFRNTKAAKQFLRNHPHTYPNAKPVPAEES